MLQRLLNRLYKKEEESDAPSSGPSQAEEEATPVNIDSLTSYAIKKEADKKARAAAAKAAAATEGPVDTEAVKEKIVTALRNVYDPEIPVNIYDLGLIYEIRVEETGMAYVKMTLTAPNCPAAGILPGQVESSARSAEGVRDVTLDLTFDPPWNPDRMSEAAKLELGML